MSDYLHNDDSRLPPVEALDMDDEISEVEDTSTGGTTPTVDPRIVSDSTVRTPDDWIKNLTPTAGTAGDTYTDTPPTEREPRPIPNFKTVFRKTRQVIHDYSQEYLKQLESFGNTFYVIYTDGTEDEVDYTEIYDPNQIEVQTYVNEAQALAEATNQHFWHDDNGAHVTDVTQDGWKDSALSNFDDLSDNKPYHNILMNSLGILLRRALYNLVSITKSAITFYDGLGNDLSNIRASFGSDGATFRDNGKTKVTIKSNGFSVYDDEGSFTDNTEVLGNRLAYIGVDDNGKPYTRIGKSTEGYIDIGVNSDDNPYIDFFSGSTMLAHMGYDTGSASATSSYVKIAPYYTFGERDYYKKLDDGTYAKVSYGNYSACFGINNQGEGYCSFAEGRDNVAMGAISHAEGDANTVTGGSSHAEGASNTVSGAVSHAEGAGCKVSGSYSHAEGYLCEATGNESHAQGLKCTSKGTGSHAGGYLTDATGMAAIAHGYNSIAKGNFSIALGRECVSESEGSVTIGWGLSTSSPRGVYVGKYNKDVLAAEFAVGTGTGSSNRRNTLTVVGDKAYVYNGATTYGSAITSDARVKKLIEVLTPEISINFIKQLIPKHYYKKEVEEYGFYAQEVESIPDFGDVLVTKDNSGVYDLPDYRLLNYQGMIAPIVSVEQDLIARVEFLEAENTELKRQNDKLNDRLAAVEALLGIR